VDFLQNLDQKILLFLHSSGNETYDLIWLFITKPLHWIPYVLLLFYLGIKALELKKSLVVGGLSALCGLSAYKVVNLVKALTKRSRPIHDDSLQNSLNILIRPLDYSFFSGHASISMAITTIAFLILKKHYSYSSLLFLCPLLFSYSRLYLGLHYPSDVLIGLAFGAILGLIFYKIIEQVFKSPYLS